MFKTILALCLMSWSSVVNFKLRNSHQSGLNVHCGGLMLCLIANVALYHLLISVHHQYSWGWPALRFTTYRNSRIDYTWPWPHTNISMFSWVVQCVKFSRVYHRTTRFTINRCNTGHWWTCSGLQTAFNINGDTWRMRWWSFALFSKAKRLKRTGAVTLAVW